MYFNYYMMGIIVLPGILLAIYAQSKVNLTFHKYSNIGSHFGKTASEIARLFLDQAGLYHIQVVRTRGSLTDHYNHRKNIIALSEDVYDSTSISAIGVACHEVGHALQYKSNYIPIKFRNVIIPVCNFANNLLWITIVLGVLFYYTNLGNIFLWIGISVFVLSVLLNLVTLPVEYNASRRAVILLSKSEIFNPEEISATKEVLNSAALTYVASFIISVLNLLRLLIVLFGNRRND
ncbi:MAG: zinc metallopeptidase [Clostridia bacterium]|nr:zinc metallopeptidase [Clostridia bacterium]